MKFIVKESCVCKLVFHVTSNIKKALFNARYVICILLGHTFNEQLELVIEPL